MLDDMAEGVTLIIQAKIDQTDTQSACRGTEWYMMPLKNHFYIQLDGKVTKIKIP
jgi:hypothetical protein